MNSSFFKARGIAAVLMAFMLVLSGAGPTGAVGTASAADNTCSEIDQFFWTLSFALVNDDKCDPTKLSEEMVELEENLTASTEVSLYNGVYSQATQSESFRNTIDNSLTDAETVAWAKAETAIVESLKNGSTATEAEQAGVAAINDYYSVRQENVVRSYETSVRSWWFGYNTSQNEGLTQNFHTDLVADDDQYAGDGSVSYSAGTTTYTLANGSTIDYATIDVRGEFSTGGTPEWTQNYYEVDGVREYDTSDPNEAMGEIIGDETLWVDGPDAGYDEIAAHKQTEYESQIASISESRTRLVSNVPTLAQNLNDAVATGDVDPSTYLSPAALQNEYSLNYSSSGNWVYAYTTLAQTGYAGVDLSNVSAMNVDVNGTVYNGLLLSREAPASGSFQVGQTYDPANINGSQLMITDTGYKIAINENFTITEATSPDGASVEQIGVEKKYYQTTDTTDYIETQNRLLDLQADLLSILEDDSTSSEGGGGGFDWSALDAFGLSGEMVAGIIALVGVGLLARKP